MLVLAEQPSENCNEEDTLSDTVDETVREANKVERDALFRKEVSSIHVDPSNKLFKIPT